MIKYILLATTIFLGNLSWSQETPSEDIPTKGFLQTNSEFTYLMVEPVQNLRKLELFLDTKEKGMLTPGTMVIGASLIGIMDYQRSNTDSKFGYLMRHPTDANQRTKDVSEVAIHSANISLAGAVNDWISIYTEFLYSPEQSFGGGTTVSITRNLVQMRKGYIVIADPIKSPVYFALGKMDGNFGQQGSVNPFTNSTMWHAFNTLAFGARLGYNKAGFNTSIMLIQGGAQFRSANVPVDGTNIPSKLNNFALDANYTFDISSEGTLQLGASYQKGTAYCQDFPVVHFNPCQDNNPGVAYYTKLKYKDLTVQGSLAKTTKVWPGSANPNPPLDVFEASKVSSLVVGVKYRLNDTGAIIYDLSGEFSNFVAGDTGSPWERQNQIVVGLSGNVQNSKLFLEVFNTLGYAPLNFVSGGNFEDLGETHSDRDASSIGIVLGGMIFL